MTYEKFPNQTGQNWPVSPQYATHPGSSVNAFAAPQYATFPDGASPQTILGSKLKLWLDSDLGITLGTGVSAWADQSGSGNHFTQGTGVNQPAYTLGAINGHAQVDFDGAAANGDRLVGPAISNIISAAAWTVWVVAIADAIGTNSATVYLNDGLVADTGQFWGLHLRNDTPTARNYNFDGTVDSASTTYATGAYSILRSRHDGTTIFVKNGAAAESAGVASGSVTNLTNTMVIGGASDGVSFDGKIAFIAITNAVTTAGENTDMGTYLTARYGL